MQAEDVIHFALSRLAVTALVLASVIAAAGQAAVDDEKPITNEYRTTLIVTKPINEKLVLFGYYGFAKLPHKETGSVFFSPPNIVYSPKRWVEFWLAAVITVSKIKNSSDSWEFRPVAGIKFYVPTKTKLDISVLTRYEDKLVTKDGDTTSTPRFRTRPAIGIPLAKGERAWKPKTFYMIEDLEPIWRLDTHNLALIRWRTIGGYVIKPGLNVEVMYHMEFSGDRGQPKKYTGNIWRLGFRWNPWTDKAVRPKMEAVDGD